MVHDFQAESHRFLQGGSEVPGHQSTQTTSPTNELTRCIRIRPRPALAWVGASRPASLTLAHWPRGEVLWQETIDQCGLGFGLEATSVCSLNLEQ